VDRVLFHTPLQFAGIFCLTTMLTLAGTMNSSRADWYEVKSENFIFYGNVSEDTARRLVTDLEIYRSAIVMLSGQEAGPEVRPVHIFGANNSSGLRRLTGRADIAGLYTVGDDYPIFVMDTSEGFNDDGDSRGVALHEFAHHVIRSHTSYYYPLWYNEGFAEYLASFIAEGNTVTIGQPNSYFATSLSDRWMDIDDVLSAVTRYPESNGSRRDGEMRYQFYGISWLAVHYIQNTKEMSDRLPDYITAINEGVDPIEAFESAFEMTTEEFRLALVRYHRTNRYQVISFTFQEEIIAGQISVRKLDQREEDLTTILSRLEFIPFGDNGQNRRDDMRKLLEETEAKYGLLPVIGDGWVSLELAEQDYDAAVQRGEAVVAAHPEDSTALRAVADAYFHRYQWGDEKDIEDVKQARAYFARQLAIDPTNPTANDHYPTTFLYDREVPDEMAIEAVAFMVNYQRSPYYMSMYLDMAEVMLLAGYVEDSCWLIEHVEVLVRNSAKEAAERADDDDDDEASADEGPPHITDESSLQHLERLKSELGDRCPA